MWKMPIRIGTTYLGCCEDWVHRYLVLEMWACNVPVVLRQPFNLFLPTSVPLFLPLSTPFYWGRLSLYSQGCPWVRRLPKPGNHRPQQYLFLLSKEVELYPSAKKRGALCEPTVLIASFSLICLQGTSFNAPLWWEVEVFQPEGSRKLIFLEMPGICQVLCWQRTKQATASK